LEQQQERKQPRPTIKIANADGVIGTLSRANDDLVKVKVIRRRTFVKYLDAVNFTGGTIQQQTLMLRLMTRFGTLTARLAKIKYM
jgi:lambda family phage minor tail protein L